MNALLIACLSLLVPAVFGQASVDLIVVNGNVHTLDGKNPRAEAIAVSGGRIAAVGSNAAIRAMAGSATAVIDAGGRLVIPGFNDAHVHFTGIGNQFSHLDLKGESDPRNVVRRIAEFSAVLPKGRWLLGSGMTTSNAPSLSDVDAVSPDNPLLIYFSDPSSAFVNAAAQQKIKRNGNAQGIVAGTAVTVMRNLVPADHGSNWAEIAEAASNYAASLGVTSVQDMHSDDLAATLRVLAQTGRLKTRVYDCVWITEWNRLRQAGIRAATGDAMVRTGCLKSKSDGSDEERPELRRSLTDADKAGLQVMVHAIGERATANTVKAFKYAADQNGRRDRRFRVEHAHRMKSGVIRDIARSSIIASMQPHLFFSGDGGKCDDYRSILDRGARLAFGSDASITDFNPLLGIHAAVNAQKGRSISVEEAVKAYTLGSAYAEFQEGQKGSIEAGKLADLVILSDDIFTIASAKIEKVKVLKTIVDGRVVYVAHE